MRYTLHSTLYTLHSTPHTLHYALYTLHSTLYTTLHTLRSTLYTLHCTLYSLHYTLYTSHFIIHSLHLTLLTLHSTLRTLYFALYTLHITLHTPHFTLYIVHVASSLHNHALLNVQIGLQPRVATSTGCNIMTFSSLCVLTSVPLTYVWAFGFVGCILFWMCAGVSIAKVKLQTTDTKVHSRKYAYQLTCPCQTW